ncbi:MAG: hypothetical protein JWQ40_4439 [Segetibacter sp.]|nr:hypothetical protein [Segetibacter sp.]
MRRGIYCPASDIKDPHYINIGKKDIINKRESKAIHVHPYGKIHDYVSFYFGPKSPMLYSIYKGNSDTPYPQSDVAYIVTSIPVILEQKLNFVFTTGQAIMQLSTSHNNLDDLNKIDWDIIFATYWFDQPPEYVDRARKRMAELLIYEYLPVNCILGIAVISSEIQQIVEKMVSDAGLSIKVKVVQNWYY